MATDRLLLQDYEQPQWFCPLGKDCHGGLYVVTGMSLGEGCEGVVVGHFVEDGSETRIQIDPDYQDVVDAMPCGDHEPGFDDAEVPY